MDFIKLYLSTGVFAPTLFSKTFGNLVCDTCTNVPSNSSVPFTCKDCHYDTVGDFSQLPAIIVLQEQVVDL